jgi:hypothetical protein
MPIVEVAEGNELLSISEDRSAQLEAVPQESLAV